MYSAGEVISLAQRSIQQYWHPDTALPHTPTLGTPGASFVTLEKHGELRGCIGSVQPVRTLRDDIYENARKAAFEDPRFSPVQEYELNEITIEVSLLHSFSEVSFSDRSDLRRQITPGVHGVILSAQGRRALFLPQVWRKLPDFDLFFGHLGRKAGIGTDPFSLNPEITLFQVTAFAGACSDAGE
ncbi:MAG: AmmeMemoRadiSam system protein A [Fibrobacterota bacterium]